jgi:hypothetical protein
MHKSTRATATSHVIVRTGPSAGSVWQSAPQLHDGPGRPPRGRRTTGAVMCRTRMRPRPDRHLPPRERQTGTGTRPRFGRGEGRSLPEAARPSTTAPPGPELSHPAAAISEKSQRSMPSPRTHRNPMITNRTSGDLAEALPRHHQGAHTRQYLPEGKPMRSFGSGRCLTPPGALCDLQLKRF